MTTEQRDNFKASIAGFYSVHTGEAQGYSWSPCGLCKSSLGGDRFAVVGLRALPLGGGMASEYIGDCCIDCLTEIES